MSEKEKAMNDRYILGGADWAELKRRFTAHPALDGQAERYTAIRDRALDLAGFIAVQCPPSRERDAAIEHLDQAVMWANAAIARNEGGAS